MSCKDECIKMMKGMNKGDMKDSMSKMMKECMGSKDFEDMMKGCMESVDEVKEK